MLSDDIRAFLSRPMRIGLDAVNGKQRTDLMPLYEQDAIEAAALAAHQGRWNGAEVHRVSGGYGGLGGEQT